MPPRRNAGCLPGSALSAGAAKCVDLERVDYPATPDRIRSIRGQTRQPVLSLAVTMPSLSLNDLVETLQRIRLLDPSQMEEVAGKLQGQFPEPQALAGELIRRGWLTTFQAKQILGGRGSTWSSALISSWNGSAPAATAKSSRPGTTHLHRIVALKVLRKDLLTDRGRGRPFLPRGRGPHSCLAPGRSSMPMRPGLSASPISWRWNSSKAPTWTAWSASPAGCRSAEACDYIRQAAQGLQHAHEKGPGPSGHQAVELVDRPQVDPGPRGPSQKVPIGAGQNPRPGFGPLAGARGHQQDQEPDRAGRQFPDAGNAGLPGAGTGARFSHGRHSRRHIFAGLHLALPARGRAPFSRRGPQPETDPAPARRPAGPGGDPRRPSFGTFGNREKDASQASRRPLPDPRRGGPGPGRIGPAGTAQASRLDRPLQIERTPASGVLAAGSGVSGKRSTTVREENSPLARRPSGRAGGGTSWQGPASCSFSAWWSLVAFLSSGPSQPVAEATVPKSMPSPLPRRPRRYRGGRCNSTAIRSSSCRQTCFGNRPSYRWRHGSRPQPAASCSATRVSAFPDNTRASHVPVLYVGTDGLLRGMFWNGQSKPIVTTVRVNDGRWHHACLVCDGPAKPQSLFLDGKPAGKLPGNLNHRRHEAQPDRHSASAASWPGGKPGWFGFNGTVAEVRVWYSARTPEQVRQGMQTAPAETEHDLAVYYPMNELEGDSLTDRSGRGRHVRLGLSGNRNKPTRVTDHPANK